MREVLARWVRDADALRQVEHFRLPEVPLRLGYLRPRADDLFITLTGELFQRIREDYPEPETWARLGNAFGQFAGGRGDTAPWEASVQRSEAALFAAAAFYYGGFPASAYLMLKQTAAAGATEAYLACHDLLARPGTRRSETAKNLVAAVLNGDAEGISSIAAGASVQARTALDLGPSEWVPARLLEKLTQRFAATNVRAVLPDGHSEFWKPLVQSLVRRSPPAWDFFPSQIDAIRGGLLTETTTFTLQMPTGAGKTALSETLLYHHLKSDPSAAAVLIVPFRSLASELRSSLVPRLIKMGLPSRCAYGGTVPSGDEVRELHETRALVATPEALSGLLTADPDFFQRVSLVICDEGHLLDSQGRGVALELLLARMKTREGGAPRFVFVSAIVPNVEEINAWLGGQDDTVIRSTYRPAFADFSALKPTGSGAATVVNLDLHPHDPTSRVLVEDFLTRRDFEFTNPQTQRRNTFPFTSVKTQAVATARKALPMGAAVVFAANKRGNQGAIGLAEELLKQLEQTLPLPDPATFTSTDHVAAAAEYFELEYGPDWVGTKALKAGAVLHHGDVPQESREVVELQLRKGHVRLAFCTSTLAEGVNLPIRTLVLYSVQRVGAGGARENLLTRDIKNLVGRAGRAGSSTKGLVVCANEQHWSLVEPVALQAAGEVVTGALYKLMKRLQDALRGQQVTLTNAILEGEPALHSLIDGVDATFVDLAAEELGEERLLEIATELANETYAARRASVDERALMEQVFALRAQRIAGVQAAGRLGWVRETGARARLVDSVESDLAPRRTRWDDITEPRDPTLIEVLVSWAWEQPDLVAALRRAYRAGDDATDRGVALPDFIETVAYWMAGHSFADQATHANLSIDDMLGVHSGVLTYVLQTLIEQAIAVLAKLLESKEETLSPAVEIFPELLRFGVPTAQACTLAKGGVRHRRAAVALGVRNELLALPADARLPLFMAARAVLDADRDGWRRYLGSLVLENTLWDLAAGGAGDDE
ncbi:MAG: DEAD/DEAH box helicase [Myxococcales bacterium]|nr:DEAD/DEAH box helicase [Myxococcales bacterium]